MVSPLPALILGCMDDDGRCIIPQMSQWCLRNGDAGLIFPNGTLTPLGKLYQNFAAVTNLTEINITEPEWQLLGVDRFVLGTSWNLGTSERSPSCAKMC